MSEERSELITSIKKITYDHQFGPFQWGQHVKDEPIVIPDDWPGVRFDERDLFGLSLSAQIMRENPNSIIVTHANQIGEWFEYTVTGHNINSDYLTKSRFFYQE